MKGLFSFIFILVISQNVFAVSTSGSNPDISANALFLYRSGADGNLPESEQANGFSLEEIELRVSSNIDAYFRGEVSLAVEKEDGEFAIEAEEAFVETLQLPSLTVRAGKFFAAWGRHNQMHSHAFPFIDAPLVSQAILGEEGLNDNGISLSYLVPLSWFSEVTVQGFSSTNEGLFNSAAQDDLAMVYQVKNLWDLNDSSTLQLDLGFGHGRNANSELNHMYNTSLTYKWRPVEKTKYKSFSWTAELAQAEKLLDSEGDSQGRTTAFSSWMQYQFAQRWWLQARGEFVDQVELDQENTKKYSALLAFVPTEYSALRFQYDDIKESGASENEHRLSLQLNVSMGTHPAHNY